MTKDTERVQVGWGFWLGWVVASYVGIAVGLAVGFYVFASAFTLFFSGTGVVGEALSFAAGGAGFGASLGIAQWLVLRRRASQPGQWVLASTVGGAVGGAVGGGMHALVLGDEALILALMFTVVGASVGTAQWLVLRQQVAQAGWWVMASTIGGAVGGAAGGAVFSVVGGQTLTLGNIVDILVYGVAAFVLSLIAYGTITGAVLVWLLRQPITEEPSLPQEAA